MRSSRVALAILIVLSGCAGTDAKPTEGIEEIQECPPKYAVHTPSYPATMATDPKTGDPILERRFDPSKVLKCRVPAPKGYKRPELWPKSATRIHKHNIAGAEVLASMKSEQKWVKLQGDYALFEMGGTHFKNGARPYLNKIEAAGVPLSSGAVRTALDMGAGVASLAVELMHRPPPKGMIALSYAPRDQHTNQIQMAVERGVPAFLGALQTERLPLPSASFDLIHCSRCRQFQPGNHLLEIDRLLRPGGYFVNSRSVARNEGKRWHMLDEVKKVCWRVVKDMGQTTIFQKPSTAESCASSLPICEAPAAGGPPPADHAWGTPLQAKCRYEVDPGLQSGDFTERLAGPPLRPPGPYLDATSPPALPSLQELQTEMEGDLARWRRWLAVFQGLGFDFLQASSGRNLLDVHARYGGFAAALEPQLRGAKWVMNVVPRGTMNTLPQVYDRGLVGLYHDWCQDLPAYPRSYDLVLLSHAGELPAVQEGACGWRALLLELDRVLRPGGMVLVREQVDVYREQMQPLMSALTWKLHKEEDGSALASELLEYGIEESQDADAGWMFAVWKKPMIKAKRKRKRKL